jgi:hypothetical protein
MHPYLHKKNYSCKKWVLPSTNPAEWLKVYQLAIEAADGDSYIMDNYLPFCLSSSARTLLLRLPVGSVRS